jgi:hypothetical protein
MHRLKAIVHYEHRKGTLQRQSPRLTERCPLLAPRILYGVLYLRQSIIVKPVHMIRCNIQRCIQWCATMCLNKFIGSTTKGSKVELSVFHTTLPYFQSVRVPPVNYFYSHCAHCWMGLVYSYFPIFLFELEHYKDGFRILVQCYKSPHKEKVGCLGQFFQKSPFYANPRNPCRNFAAATKSTLLVKNQVDLILLSIIWNVVISFLMFTLTDYF